MLKYVYGLFAFIVLIGMSACGEDTGAIAPQIETFNAFPPVVEPGDPSLLTWSVIGSDDVTLVIDQGVGDVSGDTRVDVRPAETTTYTLTASSAFGTDTESVTVGVGTPMITGFSATPSTVNVGESSTLAWTIEGVGDIMVAIDQGVGDVTGSSSASVSPPETTEYILTATNEYGSDTESVTVTVRDEITEAALAPTSSTCDGVAVGNNCEVTVSLVNVSDGYRGVELQFEGAGFDLIVASTSTLTSNCLIDAGSTKVILVCSEAFSAPGDIARLTVRRSSAEASSFVTSNGFIALDSSSKLAVTGGSLDVSASD